jgi:hypothetical protein
MGSLTWHSNIPYINQTISQFDLKSRGCINYFMRIYTLVITVARKDPKASSQPLAQRSLWDLRLSPANAKSVALPTQCDM